MRDDLNCPNCGAPIRATECPYCGTVFYDFASLSFDKPTYIGIAVNGKHLACRARMTNVEIHMNNYELSTASVDFNIYPDDKGVMLYERVMTNESD